MKGFFAVAQREVAVRRGVLAAAAAAAALPFFAPLLPAAGRFGSAEARLYTAAFLAVAFAGALSLLLGTTAIGRDLADGRLGFFFSRPIGSGAIWAGRLAGVWLLIVLAALVILLPAGLFDMAAWTRAARAGLAVALAAAFGFAVIVFLALGSAASLALRSRSAWLAADFIALALWTAVLGVICLPLIAARAPLLLGMLGLAWAALSAAALVASVAAQVSIGRLDTIRGNRARFVTLWTLLFAVAGLTFGAVRWLLSPSLEQLRPTWVGSASPAGSWIGVEGRARGRLDLWSFLFLDVASGRALPARSGRTGGSVISRDGQTAAWTETAILRPEGEEEVWVSRLAPGAMAVRAPIAARRGRIAISPEGSRLAAAGETALGIYEIPAGRLLGSIPLDADERFSRFVFTEEDRLRLYRIPSAAAARVGDAPATIEIADYGLSARRIVRSASVANVRRPFGLTFDDRDGRLLVWEKGNSLSLFDVSDGRLIAVLGNFGWEAATRAFLSDGRIVVGETSGGAARIHLFSREGRSEKVYETLPAGFVGLGGEISPGSLVVALGSVPDVPGASDSYLVDLENGGMRRIARHLEPVAARLRWRLPRLEPGSVAARLFFDSNGALLLLDPATGKLKTLLRAQ